ncbi:MAG: hypothetical protein UT48_C0008G0008 [Parcubacteria group bacterium GW2011_GWE2_39_37]|uniref:Uncharacterized protein n=1 Tax=Candidatus Falkowbacteria bacterium GW2011_GWF2_39_8 TaxID=1618642 RepID=A0A0G0PTY8_9BACT|nr:MAG: hypothetical protein UT48_C0008G0008 [Parcubacteria group bacterium GW2011_GWE2_39_37]KKR31604.1 MAG: hypothetical protein UT64_C0055G0006 [Candidatus Falkowbacteria bacterium GW2011_GWF2_39_8]
MKKYLIIWKTLTGLATSSYLTNRVDSISYFMGKLIRLSFFLLMIIVIFNKTSDLVGYGKYEVIFFFSTFNLMDVLAQAFFRGIYFFGNDIKNGNFDFILTKPINALFYSLSRLTDILDFIFLAPIIGLLIYSISKINISFTFINYASYFTMIVFGLLIIMALHIITAAINIIAIESEAAIWLYRDSMTIGRFPPEIFPGLIQIIFTVAMPIIIIVSFPAKAFLGILSLRAALFAILYSVLFFALSLLIWKKSLKHYSSASS